MKYIGYLKNHINVLIPAFFLVLLVFVSAYRIHRYQLKKVTCGPVHPCGGVTHPRGGVKVGTVEGLLLNHPYHDGNYQVFRLKGKLIKTGWYPEYNFGDYLEIDVCAEGKSRSKYVSYYPKITIIRNNKVLKTLLRSRNGAISRMRRNMPEPYASLVLGMTLGYKSGLPPELDRLLKDLGLVHVIVVSGYNVALVLGAVTILLVGFGKKVYVSGSLIFISLFLVFTGLEPPVIRACIMGAISVFAIASGEVRYSMYILFVTGFSMLIINPLYMTDIGFQLSFVATMAVILASKTFKGKVS